MEEKNKKKQPEELKALYRRRMYIYFYVDYTAMFTDLYGEESLCPVGP